MNTEGRNDNSMICGMKHLKHVSWTGALALAMVFVPNTQAASITAQLDCNLNVLKDSGSCDGTVFGSVTIAEVVDPTYDISITVDLLDPGLKFKDMILAYDGGAQTLAENDPLNTMIL